MSSNLEQQLESKSYRDAFVSAHAKNGIAFQIRAMREARAWDQRELAEKMGSSQPVISRYENPDYGRFSLGTLLDIAKAFDVALNVKFVSYADLIEHDRYVASASLDVPSFGSQSLGLSEETRTSHQKHSRGRISSIGITPKAEISPTEFPTQLNVSPFRFIPIPEAIYASR